METYLDKETGELLGVARDRDAVVAEMGTAVADDLVANEPLVRSNPDRFLLVDVMRHGHHHDVMQEFLESRWTASDEQRRHATGIYYPKKSIGCWLRDIDDDEAISTYFDFKEPANVRLAERFLRGNGVTDFVWR